MRTTEERKKERQQEDLVFIRNSKTWPNWPYLPLKRYIKERDKPECGFLFDGEVKYKVYLCNIFALKDMTQEQKQNIQTIQYNSIHELLNDGWVVD